MIEIQITIHFVPNDGHPDQQVKSEIYCVCAEKFEFLVKLVGEAAAERRGLERRRGAGTDAAVVRRYEDVIRKEVDKKRGG